MCRPELLLLLGVLGSCAAQDGGGSAANASSTTRATCEGSTADFCVRTCCPPGQNEVSGVCNATTLRWQPSFLSPDVSLDVVGGPIAECEPNEEEKAFFAFQDPSLQFILRPSGELTIDSSTGVFDLGHDYCFRKIQQEDEIFEVVRSCVPKVVPHVPDLVNIDYVTEVSFRKCCPVGQVLAVIEEKLVCINSSADWLPDVLHGDPTELIQLPPEKARIKAGGQFECPGSTLPQHLNPSKDVFYLEADSRLLILPSDNHNITIQPDYFCLDRLQRSPSKQQRIGQVCYNETEKHTKERFEELCPEGVCVRKCCAPGFIDFYSDCIPATAEEWQPTFHDGERAVSAPDNYTLLHGRSECDGHVFEFNGEENEKEIPFLQVNGEIRLPKLNLAFKAHQCCLDHFKRYDERSQKHFEIETAVCCQPKDLEDTIRKHVTSALLSISCICLLVMLVIYMLVPKLRNVHGKCLMSHAAALFVAFFLTVFQQVVGVHLGPGCDALGLMLYYFFIAALFWLNVMSFDIWWTFAHLRPQAPSQRSQRNRFLRHSAYAWGVPLLMTMLLAFANYAPYELIPKGAILRPDLGETKCFIAGKYQELYYFYVPIFIVTGVNMVFFAATAWALFQTEQTTRMANRKRTASDRLRVYVNLFIIMEVSWIAECLSTQIGPIQAWYFTDIINACQGVLIFILFVANSTTRKNVRERFVELHKRSFSHPFARNMRPAGKTDGAALTSMPSKTTTTTNASSSATGKSSDAEAYQMTEKKTPSAPEKNGVLGAAPGGDDVTGSGLEPVPHNGAC